MPPRSGANAPSMCASWKCRGEMQVRDQQVGGSQRRLRARYRPPVCHPAGLRRSPQRCYHTPPHPRSVDKRAGAQQGAAQRVRRVVPRWFLSFRRSTVTGAPDVICILLLLSSPSPHPVKAQEFRWLCTGCHSPSPGAALHKVLLHGGMHVLSPSPAA